VPPPGFTDTLVAGVSSPTALAFTPDGRLLVTTQPGDLRVYANGALVPTPALDLTAICANSERGLLGVAVDPAFAVNGWIYLYYTFDNGPGCVNRVSRFTLAGNAVEPGSELVLIDNIHSTNGNHNGGDVQFGKDGNLYVSVGDAGCYYQTPGSNCQGSNTAARDPHVLLGKILRITKNGAIPAGNPYQGAGSGRCNTSGITTAGNWCQETFAWGLRNPFRIAFDPNTAGTTTRFFINDVGLNTWEEIDEGQAGTDYGWNVREGHCARGSSSNCGAPPAGMTNPIHDYNHSTGCDTITGGAFVPTGAWPAEYNGDYLFGDFGCGTIFRLEPSGGGYTRTEFATGLGSDSAVHMAFGPSPTGPALYYTTYAAGGQVRRIARTDPPTAPPPGPPPVPGGQAVRIAVIRFDPPGPEQAGNRLLNREWVRIRNLGGTPVALAGWRLRDAAGAVFRFRRTFVLRAGRTVTVHSGRGRSGAAHVFWGRRSPVWGNRGDRAVLRARSGALVDACRYGRLRGGLKRC
jgi:glucose/arabinose dehydrogenase